MLAWNGMGAMDYDMTSSRNETYIAQSMFERLAFLEAFPTWAIGCWGLIQLPNRRFVVVTLLCMSKIGSANQD